MPIDTNNLKKLRADRTIQFNSPFGNLPKNVLNKSESIVSDNELFSTSNKGFPSIVEPPQDPEGKNYERNADGKFIPTAAATRTPITKDQLNDLTDFGKNTQPLYDKGLDSLLSQKNSNVSTPAPVAFPVTTSIVKTISGSVRDSDITSSGATAGLDSVVTDQSRMVGQQLWNYEVTLYNHYQPPYELRAHAIKQIVIEDDSLTWPIRGYIIVDNREEGFERSYSDKYYHIRSDARDEINIKIWPTTRQGTLPDRIWKIETTCVIYDVEDLPSENMTTKVKKLYFWDKNFQILFEKNMQWSTATTKTRKWTPPTPEPIAHATDEERSMYTGDAILSILLEAGVPCDDSKWDKGLSKINYTLKADWTLWENILYILKFHVSEEKNDNCILCWNRADQMLTFLPYYKIFEQAGISSPGELQIEHFFFEEKSPQADTIASVSPFKAPYDKGGSTEKDIKIDNYNTILNYRFSQTAGADSSQAFTTIPVHSHSHKGKQFDIDVQENEIEYIKNNYFLENYVSNLMGNDYPVLVLNQTKKNHESTHPIYISRSSGPLFETPKARSMGRSRIMFGGIHLNQCLVIRVQGSTHRLSTTFVGVDRLNQNSDTNYDYALCGQYYVVNVKHIIQQQKYVNELILTKVHAYNPLQNNEDVW